MNKWHLFQITTSDCLTNPNKKTILTLKFFKIPPYNSSLSPSSAFWNLIPKSTLLFFSSLSLSLSLSLSPFYLQLQLLGLSTGRVRSVLDPTRTRPAGVGWKAEGPETDRRRHSIESVFSSGGVRVDSVGVESRWILQMSPESSKNSPKSAKIQ